MKKHFNRIAKQCAAALKIADNSTGNVTVTLEGTNVLKSGGECDRSDGNGNNDRHADLSVVSVE